METHAEELKQKAVVYINSDTNGRGLLNVDGSQALQRMVNEVAEAVKDPQTDVSVAERKRRYALHSLPHACARVC